MYYTSAIFSNDDFPMFVSMLDHKDLIFQDSTVRLVKVPPSKQTYQAYLGTDFMRAMERMENIDCVTTSLATPTVPVLNRTLPLLLSAIVLLARRWLVS